MYLPNGLQSRLEWVARTHAKRPVVAYVVAVAAMWAVGMDREAQRWGEPHFDADLEDWATDVPPEQVTAELAEHVRAFLPEETTDFDKVVPWMAAQVAAAARRVVRAWHELKYAGSLGNWATPHGADDFRDAHFAFSSTIEWLMTKGPAIAMWVKSKPDLNSMSLAEVDEALNIFVDADVGDVPQGHIIFRYDDGWTMQRLGPDELASEGEAMQHCVGDYCEAVESEESTILSLRNPRGRPHVTIEIDSDSGEYVQVMGKQNDPPKPEYAERVQQFMDWRNTPGSSEWLQGMFTLGVDLSGEDLSGIEAGPYAGEYEHVQLAGANLGRAEFADIRMSDSVLLQANLDHARFAEVVFTLCDLNRATMRGGHFLRCTFKGCDMNAIVATDATFEHCTFTSCDLRGADLRDAKFPGSDLEHVDLARASLANADLRDTVLQDVRLFDADVEGVLKPTDPVQRERYEREVRGLR